MRAWEFMQGSPVKDKPVTKTGVHANPEHAAAMPNLMRFAGTKSRDYDFARISDYVAGSDGKNNPNAPEQSWAGRNNIAAPYTDVEAEMIKRACDAYDIEWDDVLDPEDSGVSREPNTVNTKSPIDPKARSR
jgi:hypothetical protein